MPNVKLEVNRIGDVLKFEAERQYSREGATFGTNGAAPVLPVGTVVSRVTKGVATSSVDAGSTGNGVVTANPTVGAGAKPGVYRVLCIQKINNSGKFQVEDPEGNLLGTLTVGTPWTTHLTFTVADGSADWEVGDAINITVAPGNGKYAVINFSALDGTDAAAGVLIQELATSASVDTQSVVVNKHSKVAGANLVWPSGATTNQKNAAIAQLEVLGVEVEDGY